MTFQPFLLGVHVLDRAAELSEGEPVNERILKVEFRVLHHLYQGLVVHTGIQYFQIILEGRMTN
jgi:hypothetical protein